MAADHVAPAWQRSMAELVTISDEIDMLRRVADDHDLHRMASSTARAYAADWSSFESFCQRHGVSSLPALPETVRFYVTDMSMQIRPNGEHRFKIPSIERALAAIGTRHRNTGHDGNLAKHQFVANVMAGIRRGRQERRDPKRPLLLDDVRTLVTRMDHTRWPSGVAAARDTFALLFGFSTALRRSEVASLHARQVVLEPLDGIHIHLGRSKTDQEGAGVLLAVPYGRHTLTCVPCAWVRWTRLISVQTRAESLAIVMKTGAPKGWEHVCRGSLPVLDSDAPLFPRVSKAGVVGDFSLTGSALNEVVKRRLAAAGYDPTPYGFHSLRAGFVTQARRNGADTRSVRRQTRHMSDAMVDGYDRDYLPLRDNAVNSLGL